MVEDYYYGSPSDAPLDGPLSAVGKGRATLRGSFCPCLPVYPVPARRLARIFTLMSPLSGLPPVTPSGLVGANGNITGQRIDPDRTRSGCTSCAWWVLARGTRQPFGREPRERRAARDLGPQRRESRPAGIYNTGADPLAGRRGRHAARLMMVPKIILGPLFAEAANAAGRRRCAAQRERPRILQ